MSRGLINLLAVLASAVWMALTGAPAFADKRVALVVGNSQYIHVSPLRNPKNDASDLADALKGIGFEVILRLDASKSDLDSALAEFNRRSDGADVAVLYYAGHGVQYQGSNYLLPTDIDARDIADVRFRAVDTNTIRSAFDRVSGASVLILDACRDNPLPRTQFSQRALGPAGLAPIERTVGMAIVYATGPNKTAKDGDGRNSPFAGALIRRVNEPGVDILTLLQNVTSDVYMTTNKEQIPEFTSSIIGKVYLNPSESDRAAWDRISDSQDPAEFRKFIQRFPTSPFAAIAQRYIDFSDRIRLANEAQRRQDAQGAADRADQLRQQASAAETQRRSAADRDKAEQDRQGEAALADQRAVAQRRLADDARRREAERFAAEEQRKEADRVAAERRRSAEDARAEQARQRIAALAIEQADDARKEEQRRAADEAKRLAALEQKEAEKRQADAEKRRVDELCERENAELKTLAGARQVEPLEALRKRSTCPTIGISIARELRETKTTLARACQVDRKALGAVKASDLAALRSAADRMTCDVVRGEAQQRIARLADEQTRTESACAGETQTFKAIDASALDAQKQYSSFRDRLSCDALRPRVDQALAAVKQKTTDAQSELARLGCYNGPVNGALDDSTQKAMGAYFAKKGEGAQARLSDDLLSSMKSQNLRVCPETAAPIATAPDPGKAVEPKPVPKPVQKAKQEEDDEPAPIKSRRHKKIRPAAVEEQDEPIKPSRRRVIRAEREEQPEPRVRQRPRPMPAAARPHREAPAVARRAPAPPPVTASHSAPAAMIHGSGF